jgi:alpha-methylacyl-CoA racemase
VNAALTGTRVLTVGQTLPGMYCAAVLRDLGAEITRIEPPHRGSGRYSALQGQFPTESLLRGTSRCAVDLHHAAGRHLVRRLAGKADVVLEGFRPGAAAALGIDYRSLGSSNPALVYAAISGYGQEGPAQRRPGHDVNYLAATGVLDLTRDREGNPVVPGVTMADGLAGLSAAVNILAALQMRSRSGRGQFLDLAIIDGPLFLMSMEFEHYWRTGKARGPRDTHLTGRFPWYGVAETKDGGHLAIGAVEPHFYTALCHKLGRGDLEDRQFAEGEELEEAARAFRAAFHSRGRDEWTALLADEDVCVAPVLGVDEAADSVLAQRARTTRPGEHHPSGVRSPVRCPLPEPVPERDTVQTLAHFGLSAPEVAMLREQRAIGD